MTTRRRIIWGSALSVTAALLLLDLLPAYPAWLEIGPVCLGVAGCALLADQIACSPWRQWGYVGPLSMIGLGAGAVAQDAGVVVDKWSVWPFVAAAVIAGLPPELHAARRRRHGTLLELSKRRLG